MDLITVSRKGGYAFDVRVRRNRVSLDLSPADGGKGNGFTPAELFAGSLGACIAMAVQTYCDTCGFAGGDVGVSLAFELMGNGRAGHKRVGAIAVDVDVPPGIPEDHWEAVRRVAEGAVICESLRHPPEVDVDILFEHQQQPGLDHLGALGP